MLFAEKLGLEARIGMLDLYEVPEKPSRDVDSSTWGCGAWGCATPTRLTASFELHRGEVLQDSIQRLCLLETIFQNC